MGGKVPQDIHIAAYHAEIQAPAEDIVDIPQRPVIDQILDFADRGVVEERMASVTALEALRQAVKTKYPK